MDNNHETFCTTLLSQACQVPRESYSCIAHDVGLVGSLVFWGAEVGQRQRRRSLRNGAADHSIARFRRVVGTCTHMPGLAVPAALLVFEAPLCQDGTYNRRRVDPACSLHKVDESAHASERVRSSRLAVAWAAWRCGYRRSSLHRRAGAPRIFLLCPGICAVCRVRRAELCILLRWYACGRI